MPVNRMPVKGSATARSLGTAVSDCPPPVDRHANAMRVAGRRIGSLSAACPGSELVCPHLHTQWLERGQDSHIAPGATVEGG